MAIYIRNTQPERRLSIRYPDEATRERIRRAIPVYGAKNHRPSMTLTDFVFACVLPVVEDMIGPANEDNND